MRLPVLLVLFLTGLIMAVPAPVFARDTELEQKILPMNCVFEEVNDGLGSLYYLTPKECGIITPPPSAPGPSSNPVFVQTPLTQSYTPGRPLSNSLDVHGVLPWQPIVAVVRGDGSVTVSTPGTAPSASSSLGGTVKQLLNAVGAAAHPTPTKMAVGVTAGVLIVAVVILALL